MSAVVDKCVNSFLKHSLFVSNDDVRCFKLQHFLKTVISVDNTSVKVIKVAGCVSSAVQQYHRSDIRWYNRYSLQYHPLRSVA